MLAWGDVKMMHPAACKGWYSSQNCCIVDYVMSRWTQTLVNPKLRRVSLIRKPNIVYVSESRVKSSQSSTEQWSLSSTVWRGTHVLWGVWKTIAELTDTRSNTMWLCTIYMISTKQSGGVEIMEGNTNPCAPTWVGEYILENPKNCTIIVSRIVWCYLR